MIKLLGIVLILVSTELFSQVQSREVKIESVCNCIKSVVANKEKVEFVRSSDSCFRTLLTTLLKEMPREDANNELGKIITEDLKDKCSVFNKYVDMDQQFGRQRAESKIKNPNACHILRAGEFIDRLSPEIIVSMRDSIQVVTFKDIKAYSRSKVTWLDDCTYRLVLQETTHPYEKMILDNNIDRIIRVINIINGTEIFLEVEIQGRYDFAQLVKQ